MTQRALLPPDLLGTYQRDGAVCLRGCFSEKWIGVLNRGVDRNIANPGRYFSDFTSAKDASRAIKDDWCWEHIPEYREFFYSSPAAGIVGELMDAQEVRFLEDQYFQKESGSSTPTPWHQDQTYYEIKGRWCVMWIPLDRVEEADSLRVVVGSHRWGRLFRPVQFSTAVDDVYARARSPAKLEKMVDIDAEPDKYLTTAWAMNPGDCVVFHPCTIHGNRGNRSGGRARRLSMRWTAEDAYYDEGAYPWEGLRPDHGLHADEPIRGSKFPLVWTRARGLLHEPTGC
jgi:ectoine hydroxylase-related dioxygenase (phytanoyl-CoA dioxygenase family)